MTKTGETSFWQRRTGRALMALAGVALFFAIVAAAIWYRAHFLHGIWSLRGWRFEPFDTAQWQASRLPDRDNVRGKMLRSLLREHPPVGLSRAEVVALLGPPEVVDGRAGEDAPSLTAEELAGARTLEWHLGAWSGFGGAFDYFSLTLDSQERVVSWAVVQH